MSLRPFLTKLLAPSALFIFIFALTGASTSGCGPAPDAQLTCDPTGKNCFLCDSNGCTPANPTVGSSGSGGNGGSGGTGEMGGMAGAGGMAGTGGAGGKAPCDPKLATCGCVATADCTDGMLCIDNLCIIGCNNSYECGGGKVCVNGKCEIGCNDQMPCGPGQLCNKGFCVPDPVNPQCSPTQFCPVGQTCIDGVCETSCMTNANCPIGDVCDYTTEGCIPNPSPTPSCGPGKACPGTAQCGGDGYCHYGCVTVTECKLIDNRFSVCAQNICKTDAEVNPQCNLSKPCPVGQDCVSNLCK